MNRIFKMITSIFLVSGTCIGGGMLALPVKTGGSGFFPSIISMIVSCFIMSLTALLYLEVILGFREKGHIISLTEKILGKNIKILSWFIYLFMSYAAIVAYASAGGSLFVHIINSLQIIKIPIPLGIAFFILLFGSLTGLGPHIIQKVNTLLVVCMIVAYLIVVTKGLGQVNYHLLFYKNYKQIPSSISILLTVFSFQAFIIPSLCTYLEYNLKELKISILGGLLLTFSIYFIWQFVVLGMVPVDGPMGLNVALAKGRPITLYMQKALNDSLTSWIVLCFSLTAITTSFLGITYGLSKFLKDSLNTYYQQIHSSAILSLILFPTLLFALRFKKVFIYALKSNGGFGDTILNGLLPVCFAWVLRYKLKVKSPYTVFGGKKLLILIFLIFLTIFFQELRLQIF